MRISDWSSDVCSSDLIERGYPRIGDDRIGHAILLGASGGGASGGDEGEQTERGSRLRHLPAGDPRGACQGVRSVFTHGSRPLCLRLAIGNMAGPPGGAGPLGGLGRSEEHTAELQPLMRMSYADSCFTKNIHKKST